MIFHIITAGDVAGAVGEVTFAHAVDLFELGSGFFEVFADIGDEGFDGFILAFEVKDDEGFVVVFHLVAGCWGILGRGRLVEAVHGCAQTRLQGADDGIRSIPDDDAQSGSFFIAKFAEHMTDEAVSTWTPRLGGDT